MKTFCIVCVVLLGAFGFAAAADSQLPSQKNPAHNQPQGELAAQVVAPGRPEPRWLRVQAESHEYTNAAGPEMVLAARIGCGGGHPVGQPEKMQWLYSIMVDDPWMSVANLNDFQKPFEELRGSRPPLQFNQTKILMKAKLVPDRFAYGRPVLLVGWIRALDSEEPDWQSPWLTNLPLLPASEHTPAIGWVFSCQAVGPADSNLGYSGVQHARQKFKVLEVFKGEAQAGQELSLSYSYCVGRGGDVLPDQKVIWLVVKADDAPRVGYAAISDTPNNRIAARELAKRLNESAMKPIQRGGAP